MGNHLNGLAQIVTATFFFYDAFVYFPCGVIVIPGGFNACKSFVVTQVEIGFLSVGRHIAFTMLVGVECSRVNIDIGVEFLDCNAITACLQQLAYAR